jgi:hypothetical protein
MMSRRMDRAKECNIVSLENEVMMKTFALIALAFGAHETCGQGKVDEFMERARAIHAR